MKKYNDKFSCTNVGRKEFDKRLCSKNADNNIIGYTTFFFTYFTWVGKSLYIDDLYVKQVYRGNGVGYELINSVKTFAEANNCKKLRWQVSNWNKPAIKFYEWFGATINKVEMNCDIIL